MTIIRCSIRFRRINSTMADEYEHVLQPESR